MSVRPIVRFTSLHSLLSLSSVGTLLGDDDDDDDRDPRPIPLGQLGKAITMHYFSGSNSQIYTNILTIFPGAIFTHTSIVVCCC